MSSVLLPIAVIGALMWSRIYLDDLKRAQQERFISEPPHPYTRAANDKIGRAAPAIPPINRSISRNRSDRHPDWNLRRREHLVFSKSNC